MDFRDLNYVLSISQHQNITKAAASLFVSQPTLSKFLKTLEDELGQKLFRKVGNKYIPTYAGERYIEKAEIIMQLKRDLDLELADIIKREVGVLKVAFPTMRCTYMLPCTLPPFHKMYPNVKVEISEGYSDELDSKILEGAVELAFYNQLEELSNPLLDYEVIGEEEMLICTCKDHPLKRYAQPNPYSKYPKLDISLLKNELTLMMFPRQRTRQIMEDYLQHQSLHLENVIYTSNLPAIMELVALGYGVSFIFEPHLYHRAESRPIDCYSFGDTKMVSNFVVAYRKGSYLPSYARDFIELTSEIYKQSD